MIVAPAGAMSTPRLPLLACLIVLGCTARAPTEAERAPAAAGEPSGPALAVQSAPVHHDPCGPDIILDFHGWKIRTPVPCQPIWIDKGDPPPEAVGAKGPDEVDPSAPLAPHGTQAGTGRPR
jgi:hypothetical protein